MMKKRFDKLKSDIEQIRSKTLAHRVAKNPHPNSIEYKLGVFIEMLEPQVRQAVLTLHKKGYSTDASGFMMGNSCEQMIEGDFKLEEKSIKTLTAIGTTVETNPSGYTRLQFKPSEANIEKIKKQWDKIVSLLPGKKQVASPSMTRKAREFRANNQ